MIINCTNSNNKAVRILENGANSGRFMAFALQKSNDEPFEFWFAVGNGKCYASIKNATRAAAKEMERLGYKLNIN
jgi:hypothetical protein